MEIVRIVRMRFRENEVAAFQKLFNERRDRIRNFPGCRHLELWRDSSDGGAFFTYSVWESEDALNHYRFSEFFKETWGLTRSLFSDKAAAWTAIRVPEGQ